MRLYNVLANSNGCLSRMSCGVAITGACARLAVNGVQGSFLKTISYDERLLIRFGGALVCEHGHMDDLVPLGLVVNQSG